ncbi:MAG: hypothetical protein IPO98_16805 [Saprospiraceae bacterium]|nr:hypothetical protein [Saprospiraceae bacterium]
MEQKIKIYIIRLIFLLPVIWFSASTDMAATHIVGGNLTYKHISGDLYQVKVVLRRDCFLGDPEADFDNPASVGIFTAGGALAVWLGNNGQIMMPFMTSDTLNEFIRSDCGFEGTQVCVHETTYSGNIILPPREGGYILAYQRCCRNATLSNIKDPLETGGTWWLNITEEALNKKNSTPEFKKWPEVYLCANAPLKFDNSALDINGDSLVYKLCTPSSGATKVNPKPQPPGFPPYNVINWAAPYGLNDMIGGVPLKIDSKTGEITATPNLVGQFLAGVCVEEYRNGVLLSIVRRDFQFNVRVCSQPPLAQFNTTETNCDGLNISFFNTSLSASNFQWDFNYPSTDPKFKSTETNPVFTFPSVGTYNVRLRATRGTDGCFDTLIQKVSIFNNKITPEFSYELSACDQTNDSLKLKLSDKSLFDEPGYQINQRNWTVTQNGKSANYSGINPVVSISYAGDVTIVLNLMASNACQSSITKQLKAADFAPKTDFKIEYAACPVNDILKIRLINLTKENNPFTPVTGTKWQIGSNTYNGDSALVSLPYTSDSILIKQQTDFGGFCKFDLNKKISLLAPPSSDFKVASEECSGLNVSFTNTSANANTYKWSFNYPLSDPTYTSTDKDPAVTYTAGGKYKVQLIATRTSDGCQDTKLKEIGVFVNKITPDFSFLLSDCEQLQDSLKLSLKDASLVNEPGYDIASREWIVTQNGKESKYTGANPEIKVGPAGDITIRLNISASNGCNSTITKSVKTEEIIPNLDFKIEYVECPVNDILKFRLINLSKDKNPFASITGTTWLVGTTTVNGDSSVISLPYTQDSITIKLQTDFAGKCSVDLTRKISLLAPPSSDFKVASEECSGLNVSFTNTSANANTYKWSFNYPLSDPAYTSTDKDPAVTYTEGGKYKVQLIATRTSDGCQDTILKEIGVFVNKITPDFSFLLSDCEQLQDSLKLSLKDASLVNEPGYDIASREWIVTQNGKETKYAVANPEIKVGPAGDITIRLNISASNGCNSTITKSVKTEEIIPNLDFKIEYVECPVNDILKFRLINLSKDKNPFASITGTTWLVGTTTVNGDSSVISLPYTQDSITIKLQTDFAGKCSVDLTRKISLLAPPSSDFKVATEECSGLNVSFTNTSANANTYKWSFNYPLSDPAYTSTDKDPAVTYTAGGKYKVQLIATRTSDGCQDTILKEIGVFVNKITPDFSFLLSDCEQLQDSLKLSLKDASLVNEPGYDIASREWIVTQNGKETKYTGANPEIKVGPAGDITIRLNISASNGCNSTITKSVKTEEIIPNLDFKIEYVECPVNDILKFRLINLSKDKNPFASITGTTWLVGTTTVNGDSSLISLPYTQDSITIKLQTDFAGKCSVDLTRKISLLAPPSSDFKVATEECGGLNVSFTNTSANVNTYKWNFKYPILEPAFASSDKDPVIAFGEGGKYKVQLIAARTSDGCQDTILKEIGVFVNKITPDFSFLLSDCEQLQDSLKLSLKDASLVNEPGYDIASREWIVTQNGKETKYAGANPEIKVGPAGDITIRLNISASNGCNSTITKSVITNEIIPELDFKIEYLGCPVKDTISVRLVNLSGPKNPFAEIVNTNWIVGNTTLSGDSSLVSILYDSAGLDVKLEASFKGTCRQSLTKNIPLIAPPLAAFSITNNACSGLTANFENSSAASGVYEWNFNYPSNDVTFKSTEKNPIFTFPSAGIYRVLLKSIRVSDGCFDTISKNIPVFENLINPDYSVTLNGCDQATDQLNVTLTDLSTFNQPGYELNKWKWTVNQNNIELTYSGKTTEVLLSNSGVISITLDIESSNGCTSKISKPLKIDELIPELDFKFELVGCPTEDNAEIKINNLSGPLNPYAIIDSSLWQVNGLSYQGDSILVKLAKIQVLLMCHYLLFSVKNAG